MSFLLWQDGDPAFQLAETNASNRMRVPHASRVLRERVGILITCPPSRPFFKETKASALPITQLHSNSPLK
jgi:hypothetical protein